MKKPEKKKEDDHIRSWCPECFSDGYNNACDEWEKYHEEAIFNISSALTSEIYKNLPSEEEIFKLLDDNILHYEKRYGWNITSVDVVDMQRELAKEISKRIKGE